MKTRLVFISAFLFVTNFAMAHDIIELILEDYHDVQTALAKDLFADAQVSGNLLAEHAEHWLEDVSPSDPRYPDVKNMFDSAKVMAALPSEKEQDIRHEFELISNAVISVVRKVSSLQAEWQLYYCSMVKKFWTQPKTDSVLMNPYAGTQMQHCGSKKPW